MKKMYIDFLKETYKPYTKEQNCAKNQKKIDVLTQARKNKNSEERKKIDEMIADIKKRMKYMGC